MAVNYTPGTSGNQAVAKSMQITNVNAVAGDEDVDYASDQSSMSIVKPVMSPNIRVVSGQKPSASLTTGSTGNR